MESLINYSDLIDGAMRGVVRDILKMAAKQGLPGGHHFYISFRTQAAGVHVSEALRARYPQEMTIVLQHQFWDFKVEEQQFQVSLSFSGVPEKLVIPYAALTAFADPSVKFGLQFQQLELGEASPELAEPAAELGAASEEIDEDGGENGAEIISLDAFRKK